tara:strand:- start:8775 stop:9119 length:345 start_codon:yes stop_codon:yes gene_type:complete
MVKGKELLELIKTQAGNYTQYWDIQNPLFFYEESYNDFEHQGGVIFQVSANFHGFVIIRLKRSGNVDISLSRDKDILDYVDRIQSLPKDMMAKTIHSLLMSHIDKKQYKSKVNK